MKTSLQITLAAIAPSLLIRTHWEHDPDLHDIRKDCDGFDDEDPDNWQAWQSEVRASAIHDGDELTGSAYLGGTWEQADEVPEESNPTISGYEPQMTLEAIEELAGQLPPGSPLLAETSAAADFLRTFMREEYEAQQTSAVAEFLRTFMHEEYEAQQTATA